MGWSGRMGWKCETVVDDDCLKILFDFIKYLIRYFAHLIINKTFERFFELVEVNVYLILG